MGLVDLFFYALVGAHLCLSYRQLMKLTSALEWINREKQHLISEDMPMNMIHILIPVYQEAEVIKASVEYFNDLGQFPNVFIYYITTEKEGSNSDTVAALKQMQGRCKFLHLHYPETGGIKAHQLNWAIGQILASHIGADPQAIYFGIYDVDSRPEVGVIKTILYGKDPIYQQPSIYLENFTRIGPIQKTGALFQTKWELCGNIPIFRAYERSFRKERPVTSLPHCTGHGLYIRADILNATGFLDTGTLTEDLEFGYRAAFRGIPITLLHEIDYTQYAPTFPATVRQTSRWFHGEMNLYRYYNKEKKRGNEKKLGGWFFRWLILKRYGTTLKWALGAPLVGFILIELVGRNPINIALVFLSAFLYVYLPFKSMLNCSRWDGYTDRKQSLLALTLLGCVVPLLNTCGPFHFFLLTVINRLRGRPASFVRTPKN